MRDVVARLALASAVGVFVAVLLALHLVVPSMPVVALPSFSGLPTPKIYSSRWFPQETEPADYTGSPDRRFIYINQNQQKMYIFEDGEVVRVISCSTGIPSSPQTRTRAWTGRVGAYWGTFEAFGVLADDAWFLYKDDGNILIHGAPYTLVDGKKVYQDMESLGKRPSSHGCVRISPEDARWLTAWGPKGVLAMITPLSRSFEGE